MCIAYAIFLIRPCIVINKLNMPAYWIEVMWNRLCVLCQECKLAFTTPLCSHIQFTMEMEYNFPWHSGYVRQMHARRTTLPQNITLLTKVYKKTNIKTDTATSHHTIPNTRSSTAAKTLLRRVDIHITNAVSCRIYILPCKTMDFQPELPFFR